MLHFPIVMNPKKRITRSIICKGMAMATQREQMLKIMPQIPKIIACLFVNFLTSIAQLLRFDIKEIIDIIVLVPKTKIISVNNCNGAPLYRYIYIPKNINPKQPIKIIILTIFLVRSIIPLPLVVICLACARIIEITTCPSTNCAS